ncbi:MAG: DUF4367 domain-containing protein [Clostridia bacterium]|nr:DUF4367 domain-containing protein [Clostridia bacterium]
MWIYHYENDEENQLQLSCRSIQQGALVSIDNEHSDHKELKIGDRPADLYRSNTPGYPSYLLWTDPEESVFFLLMSEINPDELIKMAKSVTESP